jgi:hypothetical protein
MLPALPELCVSMAGQVVRLQEGRLRHTTTRRDARKRRLIREKIRQPFHKVQTAHPLHRSLKAQ